jgi:hypothetical protein
MHQAHFSSEGLASEQLIFHRPLKSKLTRAGCMKHDKQSCCFASGRGERIKADFRLSFEVLPMRASGLSLVVVFGKTTDGTRRRARRANPDVESRVSKEQPLTDNTEYSTQPHTKALAARRPVVRNRKIVY